MRIRDWSSDVCNTDNVDSFYTWKDFKAGEIDIPGRRPFGERPVSIGYDPNKQGRDDAALAVVALPDRPGGKFRVLEKIRCNGKDFEGQAEEIKRVAARYNVVDIAIDTTAHGLAVWEHVRKRSEEHTSELQSLMRISYAVFCLKKKNTKTKTN